MIKLAIIGCGVHSEGSHGEPMAMYAKDNPDTIELVAACDIKYDRAKYFQENYGFKKAYTDMDEMLDKESLDGVVSVMGINFIAEIGCKLLQRGIPCCIEKPLGACREETEKLLNTANETHTLHMISVNRRYSPYINKGLDYAKGKGPIRYIRGKILRNGRNESSFIWETAIHVIDTVRYIGGNILKHEVNIMDYEEIDGMWYNLSLEFENGCIGSIDILPTVGSVEETYEMFGNNNRVLANTSGPLNCWEDGKLKVEEAGLDKAVSLRDGSYNEVHEFVQSLLTGEEPRSTIQEVAPSMNICWDIVDLLEKR